ncbi:MAG: deoxyribonuclease IV [Chloroflexi bacterium]|nr:deoxyribonuclease IV [Chloroflexota bacterium]
MRIGAHVSAAGSLDKAIDRAQAIGAEAIQVFASPPQGWRTTEHSVAVLEAFARKAAAAGITPVFLHGVYLINLATESAENLAKSVASLVHALGLCSRIGAQGVIFHVGSHRGAGIEAVLDRVVTSLGEVLAQAPQGPWLCLENNAGQGQQLGATFEELRRMIDGVGDSRLRICLDTAHTLASGYDIITRAGLSRTMDEFDRVIGLGRLVVVHANDSKVPQGSNMDRHENIGDGHIGREGWLSILAHPAFRDLPFLLEVPGVDGKSGPDVENVDRLKALRAEALGES